MNMKKLNDKYIKSIEIYKFCKFICESSTDKKDFLNLEEAKRELIFYNRSIRKSILVNKNNKVFCKKCVLKSTAAMYKRDLNKLLLS